MQISGSFTSGEETGTQRPEPEAEPRGGSQAVTDPYWTWSWNQVSMGQKQVDKGQQRKSVKDRDRIRKGMLVVQEQHLLSLAIKLAHYVSIRSSL